MLQILISIVAPIYILIILVFFTYRQSYFFLNYLIYCLITIVTAVIFAQYFQLYKILQQLETVHSAFFCSLLDIKMTILGKTNLLIYTNTVQKSFLDVGVECSSFLEMLIFGISIVFYPLWKKSRKFYYLSIGLVYIYCLNLLRIMLIITTVTLFGDRSLFLVHTIVARLFFFLLIMLLYHKIFTQEALTVAQQKVKEMQ